MLRSKKEGKHGVSKFIKLSKDLGMMVSDLTVVEAQGSRRRSIMGKPEAPGFMFSVGDDKGTIDLKVHYHKATSFHASAPVIIYILFFFRAVHFSSPWMIQGQRTKLEDG